MYTAMEVDTETIADTESVERNCYCRGTLKRCGNISTGEEKRLCTNTIKRKHMVNRITKTLSIVAIICVLFMLTGCRKTLVDTTKNNRFAYICPDPEAKNYSDVAEGIRAGLSDNDTLDVLGSYGDFSIEKAIAHRCVQEGYDGVFLTVFNDEAYASCAEGSIPAIMVKEKPMIIFDDYMRYRVLTTEESLVNQSLEYLLQKLPEEGSVLVYCTDDQSIYMERFKACRKVMNRHTETEFFFFSDFTTVSNAVLKENADQLRDRVCREAYEKIKKLLNENSDIRGIWAMDEIEAIGAARAVAEVGKEKDVLIVTVGWSEELQILIDEGSVICTATDQNYEMGLKAASMLYHEYGLLRKRFIGETIVMEPQLIISNRER